MYVLRISISRMSLFYLSLICFSSVCTLYIFLHTSFFRMSLVCLSSICPLYFLLPYVFCMSFLRMSLICHFSISPLCIVSPYPSYMSFLRMFFSHKFLVYHFSIHYSFLCPSSHRDSPASLGKAIKIYTMKNLAASSKAMKLCQSYA